MAKYFGYTTPTLEGCMRGVGGLSAVRAFFFFLFQKNSSAHTYNLYFMSRVSVALLQIDSVLCNVVLRSMAMAVGIFSLTGLAIGGIFLASKRTMSDIQFRASWTEVRVI